MFLLRLYSCGKLVKQMQLTIMTAPRKALITVLSVNFLQLILFSVIRITRKIRSLRQIILHLPTRPSLQQLNQHQEIIFKVVELPKNVGRSVEICSWYPWKGTLYTLILLSRLSIQNINSTLHSDLKWF